MSSSKSMHLKFWNYKSTVCSRVFRKHNAKEKKILQNDKLYFETQNSYIYITVLSNHRTLNTKIDSRLAILLNFQETKHFTNFTSRTNGISTSYFTLILVVWHSRVVSHYFYESIRLFFYPQDSFTITSLCS